MTVINEIRKQCLDCLTDISNRDWNMFLELYLELE